MPQFPVLPTKRPNIVPALKEYYQRPDKLHKLGTIEFGVGRHEAMTGTNFKNKNIFGASSMSP